MSAVSENIVREYFELHLQRAAEEEWKGDVEKNFWLQPLSTGAFPKGCFSSPLAGLGGY
jgi:hypothetical protein